MKRALLVGIDRHPLTKLTGCVNDVDEVARHLERRFGFDPNEIQVLRNEQATRDAIVAGLQALVSGAEPGDQLLFQYSGHAVREEAHEALVPADRKPITAPDLRDLLADVPKGAALTCVIDARFVGAPRRVRSHLRDAAELTSAAIVMACGPDETGVEVERDGRMHGALTWQLLSTARCEDADELSLADLVAYVGDRLTVPMHPTATGSAAMLTAPFLGGPERREPARGPEAEAIADSRWREVVGALLRLGEFEGVRRAIEEVAGPIRSDVGTAFVLTRALREVARCADGIRCETYWWGFELTLPHQDLAWLTRDNALELVGALGLRMDPAAAFAGEVARFVAAHVAHLKDLDRGAGVRVAMTWLAPNVFVPTAVAPAKAVRSLRRLP